MACAISSLFCLGVYRAKVWLVCLEACLPHLILRACVLCCPSFCFCLSHRPSPMTIFPTTFSSNSHFRELTLGKLTSIASLQIQRHHLMGSQDWITLAELFLCSWEASALLFHLLGPVSVPAADKIFTKQDIYKLTVFFHLYSGILVIFFCFTFCFPHSYLILQFPRQWCHSFSKSREWETET